MSSPRLPLSSRPTFLPDEISRREFATVFRGYDPSEVRTFLNQLSEQSADLADRVAEIQKALAETEERIKNPELTEEMVTQLLGEQTAQILRSAREAAADTRRKTDEEVGRSLRDAHEVTSRMKEEAETLLRERTDEAETLAETARNEANAYAEETRNNANEEAARIRNEIAAEAERRRSELDTEIMRRRDQAEREMNDERTRARQESRDIIDTARMEAQSLVERTQAKQGELIDGLVRRRKIALAQLDSLRAGRQRLLGAYKMVRSTLDDVTAELEKVEEEARQAGMQAGQRAAEAAEIETSELDQVIEVEQFELEDDVPQNVIDLVENEDRVATGWQTDPSDDTGPGEEAGEPTQLIDMGDPKGNAPFDFNTSSYEKGESDNNVVNLTVINGQDNRETAGGDTSMPSAPTGTLTREVTAQHQATDLTVEAEDDYEDDEDDDFESEARTSPALIIGESYGNDDEARSLKLRRDAVVGKARSQAVRRLRRALQDEQDSLIARTRTGEFRSVQALLGSPDDQAASYHRAVVKLLREVVRTGASSVPGSTGVERGTIDRAGTSAARALADQVVEDLRSRVIPQLDGILEADETPSGDVISQRLGDPYNYMKGEYLDQLVDQRVGMVFDEGVGLTNRA